MACFSVRGIWPNLTKFTHILSRSPLFLVQFASIWELCTSQSCTPQHTPSQVLERKLANTSPFLGDSSADLQFPGVHDSDLQVRGGGVRLRLRLRLTVATRCPGPVPASAWGEEAQPQAELQGGTSVVEQAAVIQLQLIQQTSRHPAHPAGGAVEEERHYEGEEEGGLLQLIRPHRPHEGSSFQLMSS